MASSSTPSWHARGRLSWQRFEAEVALGRTARGDGIVWTTWGSQETRSRRSHAWRSIKRARWRFRSARITDWSMSRCSGLFRDGPRLSPAIPLGPALQRPGEAATFCGP